MSKGMRILFTIGLGTLFLSACSSTVEEPILSATTEANPPALATIPVRLATLPATRMPTSTLAQTPAPTISHTSSSTPSVTPTPTEDLSFYDLAGCLPQDTGYQRGKVTNIVDGDTIEVTLEDGNIYTVRYIGIDSPESGFPFFEESRNANMRLVMNEDVILIKDESEVDQYGRLLRYVMFGPVFVNHELVEQGYARAENYPPDESCSELFASAEEAAHHSMLGMWAATPTPEPSSAQVIIVTVNKRDEYVDIKNTGTDDVNLAGWMLLSERGNQDCPLSGILKAGETLRIWSMTTQEPGFTCGYSSPIWNNSEPDPAVLYNADGVEVSRK